MCLGLSPERVQMDSIYTMWAMQEDIIYICIFNQKQKRRLFSFWNKHYTLSINKSLSSSYWTPQFHISAIKGLGLLHPRPILELFVHFWVPWNISNEIHWIFCPNLLYFFRKYTVFKNNKVQGIITPLKTEQVKTIIVKSEDNNGSFHFVYHDRRTISWLFMLFSGQRSFYNNFSHFWWKCKFEVLSFSSEWGRGHEKATGSGSQKFRFFMKSMGSQK